MEEGIPNVTMATPRSKQKNCNGCVQAKRRCDRRTPTCSRCIEKMIPCTWGKPRRAPAAAVEEEEEGRENTQMATTSEDELTRPQPLSPMENILLGTPSACPTFPPLLFRPSSGPDACPISASLGASPFDTPLSGAPGVTSRTDVLDAPDNDIPMDPFLDFLNPHDSNNDQWLVQLAQGPVVETDRPGTPLNEDITETYKRMSGFCNNVEPWQSYDPKHRLYYIINRVKGFVADVATRGASPFLHKHLYKDYTPACIVSCFSTCVLYQNRTPSNVGMVVRALQSDIKGLVGCESERRLAMTPTEKLARTQALFLYQIIRLLDGDIMLRAQGQRDMPLLNNWVGDLCKVRENLGNLAQLEHGVVRSAPPEDWERWIFAESVRRTIIMTQSFSKLFEMLNGTANIDDHTSFWAHAHRWTMSRHLWEADSSFEFARMWREKPQFVITNYKFEDFLQYGRGEDVDELGEIFLTVFMGTDEATEFLSAKK